MICSLNSCCNHFGVDAESGFVPFAAVRFTNHSVVHDGNPDGVNVTVLTYAVNVTTCELVVGTWVIPLTVACAGLGP
jgi:hypothetical protein